MLVLVATVFVTWCCASTAVATTESALGRSEGTYSCGLADAVNSLNAAAETQFYGKGDPNPGPPSILSTFAENGGAGEPCSTLAAPGQWWEYELCWGRWVRQYHVERPPNQPVGPVSSEFLLGVTAAATRPDDSFATSHIVQYTDGPHNLQRKLPPTDATLPFQFTCSAGLDQLAATRGARQMVVAHMTGGTTCDASQRARETRIVLTCERRDVAVGWNISEHANMPCHYTAFVFGRGVCALLDAAATRAIHSPSVTTPDAPKAPEGQVNPNLRNRGDVERLQRDLVRRNNGGVSVGDGGRRPVPAEHATSTYTDLPQAAPVSRTPSPPVQNFRPHPDQRYRIQDHSIAEEAVADPVPDDQWAETAERLERVMWFSLG